MQISVRFALAFATCMLVVSLFAQTPATQGSGFKLFYEKTYIHTDRNYYAAGEDIWYKAYLTNAQLGVLTSTSANLYVELISPTSQVLSREIIHLDKGLGNGDFKLADNAEAGNYRIRAYTNWMKNFGDNFIFEKKIEVAADPAIKSIVPRNSPTLVTIANNSAQPVGMYHLSFFPEGGSMVVGVSSRVAFKAEDANGKSVQVKGAITTSKGESVATFESSNMGMGNFIFVPTKGETYLAKGKFNGQELFSQELPSILDDGFVLTINDENDNEVTATILADNGTAATHAGHALLIASRHNGKLNFKDTITLRGSKAVMRIPKSSLQEGVNAITMYDEKLRPHCERLVYIHKNDIVKVDVTADQNNYTPRQNATITLTITDAQQQPVKAHISLAATDNGIIPAAKSNIASYLLLESELRGQIENPMQYFDITNKNRNQQLDLLLQTQGWRDFVWRRIADTSHNISNLPEPGITISGRVRRTFIDKGISNVNITLQAPQARGDKIYFTKTDSLGRYFLDGLPLYGWQDVKITSRDAKGNKEGVIMMDTVFGRPYPVKNIPNIIYDTSALHNQFMKTAVSRKSLMEQQQNRDKGELQNVTVTAKSTKMEQLADGAAMSFGHADSMFVIQPSDKSFETVEYFLLQRYPGAQSNANGDGIFFYADGKKIRPRFKIDGREDVISQGNMFDDLKEDGSGERASSFVRVDYYSIPINKVKQIYVQPLLGAMNNPIYVIHLTLLPGALDAGDLTLINTSVNGYYEARKYYVPSFTSYTGAVSKTDLRSTLFWAPNVETDANGKATVSLNNSDAKTTILIDVQGVSDKGIPVVGTLKYTVAPK